MKRTSLSINFDDEWACLVVTPTNYADGPKWRVSISKGGEWFFGYKPALSDALAEAEENASSGKTGSIKQLEDLF